MPSKTTPAAMPMPGIHGFLGCLPPSDTLSVDGIANINAMFEQRLDELVVAGRTPSGRRSVAFLSAERACSRAFTCRARAAFEAYSGRMRVTRSRARAGPCPCAIA